MPKKSKKSEEKKKRLHRLLALLRKLDNRERMSPASLAAEFHVNRRTVLRDVSDLNASGFAITFDKEQGYYRFVDPDYTLRDLNLNEDELMVLLLGARMAHGLGRPFDDAFSSLIKKASRETGKKTSAGMKRLKKESRFWIDLDNGEEFEEIEAQYNAVKEALDRKVEIELTYAGMHRGKETVRAVAPYGLVFKCGLWYVIGYCNLRGAIRIFALDRIKDFKLTRRHYDIPPEFNIAEHFEPGWNMYRYGEPVKVVLKFSKEYARWITRRRWHPTQEIEENDDGSIIFSVTVEGTMELKWWTYHWIPFCEVLSPPELRREVMDDMRAMMNKYGE